MTALTIGIDARAAVEVPAGRGRVVRELLRAFAELDVPHRFRCYAREPWDEPRDERFTWELVDAKDPWWHLRTALRANRECDVFLSSNSYLTSWFLRIPSVPIVYDLVPWEPGMRPNRRSTVIERATLPLAVRRAAALLCISQTTADALVEHFPRAAPKVRVVLLAVSPALGGAAVSDDLPAPGFVLAVGTLEPRKNLPRLVEAFRLLPEEVQRAHPLVVAGKVGWDTGETDAAFRALGDRCRLLGYVPDADLAELYRRAGVFCYPSLGEGFGLPVLEAMAAGAAVVTSEISSLPEVGGDAAEYVDPLDPASIAAGLQRALEPARHAELAALGPERARGFSWSRTARETLDVLERAAGRPTRPS